MKNKILLFSIFILFKFNLFGWNDLYTHQAMTNSAVKYIENISNSIEKK